MHAPGRLVASGRDADIFEYGPHQVLRRAREERSQLIEAQTMEYLRAEGYPVPEVIEIDASGWEAIFGEAEHKEKAEKVQLLRRAASVVVAPTRPWLPKV